MGTAIVSASEQRRELVDFQVDQHAKFIANEYNNAGRPPEVAAFVDGLIKERDYESDLRQKGFHTAKAILFKAKKLFVEANRESPKTELQYIARQAEKDGFSLPGF